MFVLKDVLSEADRKYLNDIFKEHEVLIKNTIIRTLKDYRREDIEDCTMDVFWIACIKVDELIASPNPAGWLVKTAKNVTMNFIRRASTVYKNGVEENEEYIYNTASFENDLVEDIVYNEWIKSKATLKVLSMLNKTEKEYYVLKYKKGLDSNEIAKRQNKSLGSVRVGITRMESKIRRIVMRREFEEKTKK